MVDLEVPTAVRRLARVYEHTGSRRGGRTAPFPIYAQEAVSARVLGIIAAGDGEKLLADREQVVALRVVDILALGERQDMP